MVDGSIKLVPLSDYATRLAAEVLHMQGSKLISFWESEGYRICQSLDPSGPDGSQEWHVSVSKDNKSVSWAIAEVYASRLLRHVRRWNRYSCDGSATHLYEIP